MQEERGSKIAINVVNFLGSKAPAAKGKSAAKFFRAVGWLKYITVG